MKNNAFADESYVIEIAKRFSNCTKEQNIFGIGDDCAVIKQDNKFLVVTCDMLCSGTHFLIEINSYYELGYKSAAVNISDIAAMGATPKYAFVSIGFPKISQQSIENLYSGMNDCMKKYGVFLMGGDTVKSESLTINLTLIGETDEYPIMRNGAKAGDLILMTGYAGNSFAGFKALEKMGYEKAKKIYPLLVREHLTPEPEIEAGNALAKSKISSMMDISDGLAKDLKTLMVASDLDAEIYTEKIPLSEELKRFSEDFHIDCLETALCGGEEYGLLFTCTDSEKSIKGVEKSLKDLNKSFSIIGKTLPKISEKSNIKIIHSNGDIKPLPKNWEHF